MSGLVRYDARDGVARIELARPEVANAIDMATAHALGEAVDAAAADDAVGAVLLVGAGPRFCAGGDVAWMLAGEDRAERVERLAVVLDGVLRRLAALPKPVVVAVQGAVAGAGLAVMLSGDLVVAAPGTKFVTAYAGVGLTPDCGLSWLLPRAVGQQRALELLLTPRALDARQAQEWGLVTELAEDPVAAASALAQRLADGPAYALGQARRLVRSSWELDRAATGADESRTIGQVVVRPEAEALLSRFAK